VTKTSQKTGLSTKELTQIKETLAAGKRTRVMFTESAGQIAGQMGHVVQLDDPATQEDWILVKFGADILPFPPSDLSIAPRGATAPPKAQPKPPEPPAPPQPEFKVVREKVVRETVPPAPKQQENPVTEPESVPPAPRKPAAPKAPKAKPAPTFTVTLSYAEGEWTVGAVQGSRTLARPYLIKPAEALKMVSMLDVPGVHEAVEQILSTERSQAQAHAEKLRAELAELEVKLAELGA
jgi:outer membrane biosynthesis protein TonB